MNRPHLIVFGRYPKPGKTKTRLIPALGPAGAASFQRRLTERIVAAARHVTGGTGARLVFCHAGGDQRHVARWLGARDIDYVPQVSGDLGRRMFLAIKSAFDQGADRVVLVGTDIPGLNSDHLDHAFDSLKRYDLVLGPSTDGGYWLVGMATLKNIFDGIVWSTADVLEKTLMQARQKGMIPYLLDTLTDLDTPDDLARETGHKQMPAPYLSVIIPTCNDERQIARTIAAATSPDAEIIVSDGGSTDRTSGIAETLGAHIVCGEKGLARQQNRGASAARGEVLLFLHADTRLPEKYVDPLFETLMDRRTVIGAFHFKTDIHTPAMRLITFWTNLRASWLRLPHGDQGLFMERADFYKVGGFPEIPIAEDLYLVRKLARKGRIALAPAAITAGRRWERSGPMRTTLIDTLIAAGCLAGVSPSRWAPLCRLQAKKTAS